MNLPTYPGKIPQTSPNPKGKKFPNRTDGEGSFWYLPGGPVCENSHPSLPKPIAKKTQPRRNWNRKIPIHPKLGSRCRGAVSPSVRNIQGRHQTTLCTFRKIHMHIYIFIYMCVYIYIYIYLSMYLVKL